MEKLTWFKRRGRTLWEPAALLVAGLLSLLRWRAPLDLYGPLQYSPRWAPAQRTSKGKTQTITTETHTGGDLRGAGSFCTQKVYFCLYLTRYGGTSGLPRDTHVVGQLCLFDSCHRHLCHPDTRATPAPFSLSAWPTRKYLQALHRSTTHHHSPSNATASHVDRHQIVRGLASVKKPVAEPQAI